MYFVGSPCVVVVCKGQARKEGRICKAVAAAAARCDKQLDLDRDCAVTRVERHLLDAGTLSLRNVTERADASRGKQTPSLQKGLN